MFGKRAKETPIGGCGLQTISNNPPTPNINKFHKAAKKSHIETKETIVEIPRNTDKRPYVTVSMLGVKRRGLLDSGATSTIKAFCPLINKNKKDLKPTNVRLRAANGQELEVLGVLDAKYKFGTKEFTHPTVIVTNLAQDLILGYDFWQVAGLQITPTGSVETIAIDEGETEIADVKIESNLNREEREALHNVLKKFLVTTKNFLGRTNAIEHDITLIEGAKPFICRPHLYSREMEAKINAEIDDMLEKDIICKSKSPCCSPLVPVIKADGSIRICIDSRKLNNLTIKDKHPIPNIPHLLARIEGFKYVCVLDLSKAFWQIPLSAKRKRGQFASAQEMTAFIVPGRGLFQFKVMPFGLCNSPATQCRLMHEVLGYDLANLFVYMDDILLVAQSAEEMFGLLEEVAKRLRRANLSINIKKSKFFAERVNYVGYVLSPDGLTVDEEKVAAMRSFPQPKTLKALRRFLGLSGYYRRLIKGYSQIASPLTDMLKKDGGLNWTPERINAFEQLKEALCSAPVVANPDLDAPFTIQSDASDTAAGAALTQVQGGKERVIAYYSHKWDAAQRNWCAPEKEAGAVLLAIEHFRSYIWGKRFTVITDAKALTHVKSISTDGSSRLSRWAVQLNAYDLIIKHRPGVQSVVPDALSRDIGVIDGDEEPEEDTFGEALRAKILSEPERYANYKLEGAKILRYERAKDDIGCFRFWWKEYVPPSSREAIIKRNHAQMCHLGPEKCYNNLRNAYFWPKMRETIKEKVKKCEICKGAKSRAPATRVPMGASRNASVPFEMVAIDHWGPLPRSRKGNQYLLLVVDVFSKFVLLNPTPNTKANKTAKFMEEEVFLKFSPPKTLLSDNYRPMTGQIMSALLAKYRVERWTIPAYHSQANPAERYIRVVSTMVRAMVMERATDQRDWDVDIPRIQWAINTSVSSTTGKTPFFVVYGRQALNSGADYNRVVSENTRLQMSTQQIEEEFQKMREEVKVHMLEAQEKFRRQYDKKTRTTQFEVGERVWRKNRELSSAVEHIAQKLLPKYIPANIIARVGPETFLIRDEGKTGVTKIHANDLLKDI